MSAPSCGFQSPCPPGLIALVGPTATGKSDLGVELAQECGGEIINADAMQLYRGMDIGTAKLGESEREGIAHHLLDVLEVTEAASVADYQQRARAAVEDVRARGKRPILVGGSGLYIRAVLDEMHFPGTDPQLRAGWERELAARGPEALHALLAERDPEAARRILPSNRRRIVRALEVMDLTGQPFSANLPVLGQPRYGAVFIGLDRPAEELDARVNQRVERMFAAGLVDEVRGLEKRGLRDGPTASRALGYRQVLDYLAGDRDQDQAVAETALQTRRFVRRQRSWFRRDQRIHWFDPGEVGTREGVRELALP